MFTLLDFVKKLGLTVFIIILFEALPKTARKFSNPNEMRKLLVAFTITLTLNVQQQFKQIQVLLLHGLSHTNQIRPVAPVA